VLCPLCENSASSTEKKWKYRQFNVEMFYCPKCNKKFNAYFFNQKLSHVIVTGVRSKNWVVKMKIRKYLETHTVSSEQELAQKLDYKIGDILNALSEMQQEGLVEKIQ
jgi:hypothetical protein